MRKLFDTDPRNYASLVARLALGIVILPHGAQKLLGLFGGNGFSGTMKYLTEGAHLPWILALLVILIESLGSLMLILGLATRLAALGMLVEFIGIIFKVHLKNGFFMNWQNTPGKGEGYEFHLLVIGLSLALLIAGGGAASVDAAISRRSRKGKGGMNAGSKP